MPYKNTAVTVTILAWDTINGVGKTGDAANITVRGVGDGSEYTPSSPSITEIDSTNLKGVYSVALTAGENNYSFNLIGGKSSTSGVVIQPVMWTNEMTAKISGTKTTLDALNDISVANILAGVVEGTITIQQALMLCNAANAGKTDGMSPADTTAHLRNIADTKNRVTATHDANGNRTAITLDLT